MFNAFLVHEGKTIQANIIRRKPIGNNSVNIAKGEDGKEYQFIRFADGVCSKPFCRTPKGGVL